MRRYTGADDFYFFIPVIDQNMIVTLDYTGIYDLDVFILSDCNPNTCLATGDLTAEISVTTGTKYYIVVDGDNADDEGSYTLTLDCYVPPTNTPTVTMTPTPTGTWYSSTPTPTQTPTMTHPHAYTNTLV